MPNDLVILFFDLNTFLVHLSQAVSSVQLIMLFTIFHYMVHTSATSLLDTGVLVEHVFMIHYALVTIRHGTIGLFPIRPYSLPSFCFPCKYTFDSNLFCKATLTNTVY